MYLLKSRKTFIITGRLSCDDGYSDRQENTIIRGFIGPKSTIWTLFMFFYIASGFLLLGGLIYGSSQTLIGVEGNYWPAVVGGLGLLLTFIASQIGQKMGEEQTELLISPGPEQRWRPRHCTYCSN